MAGNETLSVTMCAGRSRAQPSRPSRSVLRSAPSSAHSPPNRCPPDDRPQPRPRRPPHILPPGRDLRGILLPRHPPPRGCEPPLPREEPPFCFLPCSRPTDRPSTHGPKQLPRCSPLIPLDPPALFLSRPPASDSPARSLYSFIPLLLYLFSLQSIGSCPRPLPA